MLHSINIRMLQKTFEGSFKSNTFVYALLSTQLYYYHNIRVYIESARQY